MIPPRPPKTILLLKQPSTCPRTRKRSSIPALFVPGQVDFSLLGAPGPGSPWTGLRPWGGDLDFETWDTNEAGQPTFVFIYQAPHPYICHPDADPERCEGEAEGPAFCGLSISISSLASRPPVTNEQETKPRANLLTLHRREAALTRQQTNRSPDAGERPR